MILKKGADVSSFGNPIEWQKEERNIKKTIKTLVIHPKDRSTDFLSTIYESIEDKTVVTGGKTKEELKRLIESHDRVMIMGHGTPYGLLNWGEGKWKINYPYIIGVDFVELLSEKTDTIYIWCNADEFVDRHKLKGFYSGMFISEVGEAKVFDIIVEQNVVDESNNTFAELMSEHIKESSYTIYEKVKYQYGLLAESNPVVSYNSVRLYHRD